MHKIESNLELSSSFFQFENSQRNIYDKDHITDEALQYIHKIIQLKVQKVGQDSL